MVRGLLASRTRRNQELTPEPRFLVSPIPASKAPEVIERYQHRALSWISDWLAQVTEQRPESTAIDEREITHFITYQDVIATSDIVGGDRDLWKPYEAIAQWIEVFLPTRSEQKLAGLSPKLTYLNLSHKFFRNLTFQVERRKTKMIF